MESRKGSHFMPPLQDAKKKQTHGLVTVARPAADGHPRHCAGGNSGGGRGQWYSSDIQGQ